MAKHSLTPDDDDVTNGASAASADVVADDFPSQLDVEEFWLDQIVVVAAVGAVDMFTAPRLTEAIGVAAAKSPAGMVVDLSKVEFLASAGICVLMAAHAVLTPNARFGVVADGPATNRPITLLGIEITLYRTLDDALQDVSRASA
jgi:anti-sigma B factor antagonist